ASTSCRFHASANAWRTSVVISTIASGVIGLLLLCWRCALSSLKHHENFGSETKRQAHEPAEKERQVRSNVEEIRDPEEFARVSE
ncbi:MAG TPA: hypothetical protein VJ778_10485, partial [Burkholderiales bacterium]|nr:hypothetical protein [Burkholderiales bacterium]